ncbi:hypothetical protein EPA93_17575 [Ktedonosporobacter rubrisoli]|uniref:Uncharacterized protein n=1 Tax=Ktedonosporobacter rubrisoli TaxID=2509675 RepID=A0A4P6JR01_KTERU|nr:hypothetical protein [Ktedonosporobacter rubrisoli]QBD77703.1 hypothetical protein EPA93_17575 [Ktedonosporobacter rubrisoli]
MLSTDQQQTEVEMLALSDDFFSVEELEERLELATTAIANSIVRPNETCGANACAGDLGW